MHSDSFYLSTGIIKGTPAEEALLEPSAHKRLGGAGAEDVAAVADPAASNSNSNESNGDSDDMFLREEAHTNAPVEGHESGNNTPEGPQSVRPETADRGGGGGLADVSQGPGEAAAKAQQALGEDRKSLTAEERMLRAAIERLAREDAEEEERRHSSLAASPSQASPAPGPSQSLGDQQGGAGDAEEAEEEELLRSLWQAQEAARQRAAALKAGRHMLTARDKADTVTLAHDKIQRAANDEVAHPMYKRAVAAAAAARGQRHQEAPALHRPDSASHDVKHAHPEKQSSGEYREDQAPVPASESAEEEAHVAGTHGAVASASTAGTIVVAGGNRPEAKSSATSQVADVPRAMVRECGLGIGVGPAAIGTWKVAKIISGGSIDRANDRAPTRLQVCVS